LLFSWSNIEFLPTRKLAMRSRTSNGASKKA